MPPRPQDWMRWASPSRTLLATTTWQKPFTFSISIMFLIICGEHSRVKKQGHQRPLCWAPHQGP